MLTDLGKYEVRGRFMNDKKTESFCFYTELDARSEKKDMEGTVYVQCRKHLKKTKASFFEIESVKRMKAYQIRGHIELSEGKQVVFCYHLNLPENASTEQVYDAVIANINNDKESKLMQPYIVKVSYFAIMETK